MSASMRDERDVRPVLGWPGYFADSEGTVYSRYPGGRHRAATKREGYWPLSSVNKDGYRAVTLYRPGYHLTIGVHRVVCLAFHGPPPHAGAVARHLNGAPIDNRAMNVAWGSFADNEADKKAHGRVVNGERQHCAKLTEDQVRSIRANPPQARGERSQLARRYGVSRRAIYQLLRGDTWAHVTEAQCPQV